MRGRWPRIGATVRYERGLLTVEATNVEVGRLLQEVAQQIGIPLALATPSRARVSLAFADQPIEAGLHRILQALQHFGRVSYVGVYDATSVTRLRVDLHAKADPSGPPPPAGLAPSIDIPVTPMDKASQASGTEKLRPMEKAQPPSGADALTPQTPATPPKQKPTSPRKRPYPSRSRRTGT